MAEQTQEELATAEREEAGRIKLAQDDMIAMGMPPEEIEKELAKRKPAVTAPAPAPKAEDKTKETQTVTPAPKSEDKKKEDTDAVLQDMLFTKAREAKIKANEEAARVAREARLATMTAEQIAAEDKERADSRIRERIKDGKLVSYEQNEVLDKIRAKMPEDEYALIMPTLEELVASKEDYDDVIFNADNSFKEGVDYAKHIASLVTKAIGINHSKLTALQIAKHEADKSVKKEIDNLQNLSGHKAPADKSQSKSELDILKERSLAGLQTSAEAERMVELMDKEK